ncbi:hypothetical protein [Azospirillum argentinense]|uniref:hypothetical protein n=1 Tax=Azospirillum argentinense TaxID=2970906 RepID=UPI0032DFFF50
MSHFAPRDKHEHARGNAGHDVIDPCRNCGAPFLDHTNGRCPPAGAENEEGTEE